MADRTMPRTEPIRLEKIKEKLQARLIGETILYFSEAASTNDLAKEMAATGAKEGTVIIAETQTSGKGPKLTLMTSLAVAKTISQLFNLKTEVKWPNDVLINAKKVCGILTEANTRGNITNFVVVGIGINANIELYSLSKQLGANATSLKHELKREIDRERFLRVLLEKMEHYYITLTERKFKPILREWKSLCSLLGSYVEVISWKEKIIGLATDVNEKGALIIKLRNGTLRKVLSGNVSLKRSKGLRHQKQ